MIVPKSLVKGDIVSVIAPASAFDEDSFYRGKAELEGSGFKVSYRADIFNREGYLAGSDVRRSNELHEAFSDERAKAIICARGGYGSMRLLPTLKCDIFAEKIFVGCSDITALLNVFVERFGLICFHGPMLAGEYGISDDKKAFSDLLDMLTGNRTYPFSYHSPNITRISNGTATGKLLGGCLSLLVSLLGTPWDFDYSNAILFIEDISEAAYSIDRMLTQLLLSGKLQHVRGIVFGEMTNCTSPDRPMKQIIKDILSPLKIPILYGFASGHSNASFTLPLGAEVFLDADNVRFVVLNSPVC